MTDLHAPEPKCPLCKQRIHFKSSNSERMSDADFEQERQRMTPESRRDFTLAECRRARAAEDALLAENAALYAVLLKVRRAATGDIHGNEPLDGVVVTLREHAECWRIWQSLSNATRRAMDAQGGDNNG